MRVVILTTYDLDEYVYEALQAGACGFLLKHAPPEELLLGVRAAADGGALLSPSVTRRLLAEFTARRPAAAAPPAALARLTSREREVLDLVIRGRSNAEIARDLVVTQSTVKTHVTHILDKLGLRDRVQAVVFGYEHGLVEPGSPGLTGRAGSRRGPGAPGGREPGLAGRGPGGRVEGRAGRGPGQPAREARSARMRATAAAAAVLLSCPSVYPLASEASACLPLADPAAGAEQQVVPGQGGQLGPLADAAERPQRVGLQRIGDGDPGESEPLAQLALDHQRGQAGRARRVQRRVDRPGEHDHPQPGGDRRPVGQLVVGPQRGGRHVQRHRAVVGVLAAGGRAQAGKVLRHGEHARGLLRRDERRAEPARLPRVLAVGTAVGADEPVR